MRKILFIILFLLFASNCYGATNTWQNGGVDTNWNTAGNWTDGVPTADDDCILPAGTQAMIINAAAVCRSLDASAYDNTITHNAAITLTIGDATAGAGNKALDFNASMTYTLGNATTSAISFQSTSATTQTIDFAGKDTGNVTIGATAVSGNYQLTGTWGTTSVNVNQVTAHVKGTLDLNDQNCYWGRFTGNYSNTKTLNMGTGTINLYYNGTAQSSWSTYTTNVTINCETSTIICNAVNGSTATFTGGGFTYYDVQLLGGGANCTLSGSNQFTNLTRTGSAVKTDVLILNGNNTVTGILNLDGNSSINRLLVYSDTLGTPRTLTVTGATISGCSNVDFRDITFANGGSNVDLSAITGGSGDCGGNTISGGGTLSFTTADDWYWHGSGTRNFSDYTYWYDATNGGGSQMASTRTPLPQDTCYINSDSIGGATTIEQNMSRIPTIDATGAGSFGFHFDNLTQTTYGSLILGMNISTADISINFAGRGSFLYLPSTGSEVNATNISMFGGTLTLTGNLICGNEGLILNNGTFDADTYNVTPVAFSSSNSNVRTLLMGSGTWTISNAWTMTTVTNLTNPTTMGETSTILWGANSTTARTFAGGGCTFNNLTITGGNTQVMTFTGSNTFNIFTITAPKEVNFTSGTNTIVSSFVATGDAVSAITIHSVTSGSIATLTDSTGTNQVYYCTINDIVAATSGDAVWMATTCDNNTVDAESTGWVTTCGARRIIFIQ